MKRVLVGVALLFSVGLAIAAIQVAPPNSTGTIEGRIMQSDLSEGIPGVQIRLMGQIAPPLVYTPSPDLTPDMHRQLDALISSLPSDTPSVVVAAVASRTQAQLLGLPAPAGTELRDLGGPAPLQGGTLTDNSGHFIFKNLAQGRYQIVAVHDGYFGRIPPGSTIAVAPASAASESTVIAGQATPEVVMTMLRGGAVGGRVLDPAGQPVSGMQVTAYQLGYLNGRAILSSVNSKTTDDRGNYRLFWLPPGEYYIAGTPARGRPSPESKIDFTRTFFPNALDARDAKTITLEKAGDVTAVNIGVRTESAVISGRVVIPFKGPNNLPIQPSTFYLLSADSKALTDSATITLPNSTPARSDGQFEIRGVPPGIYDLMTSAIDEMGHVQWGRTRINVVSGGTQGVTLTLQAGREVKAHVSVDGAPPSFTMAVPPRGAVASGVTVGATKGAAPSRRGAAADAVPASAPVPTPFIKLVLRSMEPDNAPNDATNPTFDPAGDYVFRDVPEGHYYLQASPLPENAYVSDVRIGTKSVYDGGFNVGSLTAPIEVNVNSNGAKIQGIVLDTFNKPFASSRVVLVPQETRRQNPSLYKTVLSDAAGNFTFTAVAPGEYKLFAWESAANTAWMNAEFIAKYEARGLIVAASPNVPAKVELKLIPRQQ